MEIASSPGSTSKTERRRIDDSVDANRCHECDRARNHRARQHLVAPSDLPPLKWSSLKYDFRMEDKIDGKEEAYG